MAEIGIPCTQCVAFEDSFNGALSGKSARMKVIAVPEESKLRARMNFCDAVLESLLDMDEAVWMSLER